MLLVPCPWCGPREEIEFRYGGQAGIAYPSDPEALSDEAWADFLFMRDNPKGAFAERWYHVAGCRRWFDAVRDTATYAFERVDPSGRGPPVTARRTAVGWVGDRPRRSRSAFTFDGEEVAGFEGDTIASALLANGVDGAVPQPDPRPPARRLLGGRRGAERVRRDLGAVVRPDRRRDHGGRRRRHGGRGAVRASDASAAMRLRAARVEHRNAHVELLVVGSGHDGFYPARDAAARGERVMLVEQHRTIERGAGGDFRAEGVTYLTSATALGLYDDGYVTVLEHADELDRLWHVRASRVILATGAFERPIAFADNDRPGVMLASAASPYLERYGVLAGARTVVFTARGGAYGPASTLVARRRRARDRGRQRDRSDPGSRRTPRCCAAGSSPGPRATDGSRRSISRDPTAIDGRSSAISLARLGRLEPEPRAVARDRRRPPVRRRGRDAFVPDGGAAVAVGRRARRPARSPHDAPVLVRPEARTTRGTSSTSSATRRSRTSPTRSTRGCARVEHVKRATYIGTAIDQGRTSGVITAEIVNALLGESPGRAGTVERAAAGAAGPVSRPWPARTEAPCSTRSEPPRCIRGTSSAAPRSRTSGSGSARGSSRATANRWTRAVERECLAVRNAVGAMDASTLGKIEVVGADAPAFLDRMYTNRMSNLAVGSIRYGLMLGLDGMVLDDGVAMRLAEDRYLVTTTTGGAATVLDRFEEWLQTEWPDLRVYCTSVTEQWAVVAINGPRARDVVSATGTDVDLSREAFPFMTFRDGHVAGVPARLARVSFSGELAYELHVPAWHGLEVWEAVMAAGAPFGIEPYGTEAMHVLRAEKGYVIVGQDTDGSVTPHDLGMDWIVNLVEGRLRRPAFAPALRRRPARSQAARRAAPGRRRRAPARRRAARARGHRPDPDAARRPRHLVVPQPGARAHVRARDAGRRSRDARPNGLRAAARGHRGRARSRRPSPTTRTVNAVTARSPLAERSGDLGPARRARARVRLAARRPGRPVDRREPRLPHRAEHRDDDRAIATCCGSGRTSGSSSGAPGRGAARSRRARRRRSPASTTRSSTSRRTAS